MRPVRTLEILICVIIALKKAEQSIALKKQSKVN
jgi:hypothetical protein